MKFSSLVLFILKNAIQSECFVNVGTAIQAKRQRITLRVGSWDNDDFLASLSRDTSVARDLDNDPWPDFTAEPVASNAGSPWVRDSGSFRDPLVQPEVQQFGYDAQQQLQGRAQPEALNTNEDLMTPQSSMDAYEKQLQLFHQANPPQHQPQEPPPSNQVVDSAETLQDYDARSNTFSEPQISPSISSDPYQQQPQFSSAPLWQQQGQEQGVPSTDQVRPNSSEDIPSADLPGARALSKETVEAISRSHDAPEEESSQGGQLFRALMARAAAASNTPIRAPQPPVVNQAQLPSNPMDLSIEEQARLFRELMLQRQSQSMQQYANPQLYDQQQQLQRTQVYDTSSPNYLEAGVGPDGRKIGRNRDAEMISTTADAYMARLKRDSTTRNYARYAGDTEKANTVFHDPSISEIVAPSNPYLEEQRAKERDMLETVPEEMLLFQDYSDSSGEPVESKVVSYKQRLAEYRAKRAQNSTGDQ